MRVGRFRPEVLAALSQNPGVARQVRQTANEVRRRARTYAPRDTGRGARSMRVVRHYDATTREVSYRVTFGAAWYMRLIEMGWTHTGGRFIPGKHFLEKAGREVDRS